MAYGSTSMEYSVRIDVITTVLDKVPRTATLIDNTLISVIPLAYHNGPGVS